MILLVALTVITSLSYCEKEGFITRTLGTSTWKTESIPTFSSNQTKVCQWRTIKANRSQRGKVYVLYNPLAHSSGACDSDSHYSPRFPCRRKGIESSVSPMQIDLTSSSIYSNYPPKWNCDIFGNYRKPIRKRNEEREGSWVQEDDTKKRMQNRIEDTPTWDSCKYDTHLLLEICLQILS